MGSAALRNVGGLCVVFLAACGDGTASTPDGLTPPGGGTGGGGGESRGHGRRGTGGVARRRRGGNGRRGTGRGGVQGRPASRARAASGDGRRRGRASHGRARGNRRGAGAAALSFAADIWPVFSEVRNPPFDYRGMGTYTGCTTATSPCHSATNPGAGLTCATSTRPTRALVKVASATSLCAAGGGTIRVVPGDPDRSCLVLFYQGRLKDDLQWVDQAEIDLVRRWIAEGARP